MNIIISRSILVCFLVSNILVAIYASRGIRTMDEYALANKSLGLGSLIATLFSGLFMSSSLGIETASYEGLISLIFPLFFALGAFILGWFVFPRITRFTKEYTIAGIMHTMYGPLARIVTVFISTLLSLFIIVGQLKAFGDIAAIFGMSKNLFIILIGITVTFYTSLGGIRSVAATDVLQLSVIIISFITFFLLFLYPEGFMGILKKFPEGHQHLLFWSNAKFFRRIPVSIAWSFFPTLIIAPPVIQHVLMTHKKNTIRAMFTSFAIFYPLLRILTLVLGLKLFIANSFTHQSMSIGAIIGKLGSHLPVAQTMLLVGVSSIFMSTIDSFLNSLAIMWTHDIIRPVMKKNKYDFNQIKWTKIITFLIGCTCTVATIFINFTLYEIEGYACMLLSAIALPFVMGVIGFKWSKKVLWISFISFLVALLLPILLYYCTNLSFFHGFLNYLCCFFFREKIITRSFFQTIEVSWVTLAIPISTLLFFIAHYWMHGNLMVMQKNRGELFLTKKWHWRDYFYWLTNPVDWANHKAIEYGIFPSLVGIFIFLTSIMHYINIQTTLAYTVFIIILKGINVILCGILLSKAAWLSRRRPYFNLFYFLTLLFCLPFTGTVISMASKTALFTTINSTLYMLLLATIVDWHTFLLLQTIGSSVACLLHKAIIGTYFPSFAKDQSYLFLSGMTGILIVILVFLRKKQVAQQQRTYQLRNHNTGYQRTIQNYIANEQQLTDTLDKRSSMMMLIEEVVGDIANQKEVSKEIKDKIKRVQSAVKHFQELAIQSKEWLLLKVAPISLNLLLQKVVRHLEGIGLDSTDDFNLVVQTEQNKIEVDASYLEKLLVQTAVYLKQKMQQKLYIFIQDATIDYSIEVANHDDIIQEGLRIIMTNQSELCEDNGCYSSLAATPPLVDFNSLEMINNLRIIQAHYGRACFCEAGNKWIYTYLIPSDLKSLRPKMTSFAQEDLAAHTTIEDEEDLAFLAAIEAKKIKKINLIKQALRTVKYYHRQDRRKSGEPFYLHPLAVATMLLEYTKDPTVIAAALLHDTIEDTPYTLRQLEATFGYEVATIVDEVTHLYSKGSRALKLNKQVSLQTLLAKESKKSSLVKLFDRLHNMQTIAAQPVYKRKVIAQETLDFFIPVAQLLRLKAIEEQLQELANAVLEDTFP